MKVTAIYAFKNIKLCTRSSLQTFNYKPGQPSRLYACEGPQH